MSKITKNMIRSTDALSIKMLNDNFDYIYEKLTPKSLDLSPILLATGENTIHTVIQVDATHILVAYGNETINYTRKIILYKVNGRNMTILDEYTLDVGFSIWEVIKLDVSHILLYYIQRDAVYYQHDDNLNYVKILEIVNEKITFGSPILLTNYRNFYGVFSFIDSTHVLYGYTNCYNYTTDKFTKVLILTIVGNVVIVGSPITIYTENYSLSLTCIDLTHVLINIRRTSGDLQTNYSEFSILTMNGDTISIGSKLRMPRTSYEILT